MTASRILVVDDETFMHIFMKHHLTRAGYEVLAARNGRSRKETANIWPTRIHAPPSCRWISKPR